MRNTAELIPYGKNAKKHSDKQVESIINSIRKFGFRIPLLITANNVIVAGHGRLKAAKKLNIEELPCILADDMTEEQIKAYRLVDNETNKGGYDKGLLKSEIMSLDFEMGDFGFNLDHIFKPKPQAGYKQTKNLDNLFRTDFEPGVNEWGIPDTEPFTGDLTGIEWVSFGEKAKISDPSNIGIHFYIDDYKFESVWTQPDKWIDLFKQCRAVVSPDFSNYTDMPKAQQLWNHYRRQWCARFWQDRGVNVISSLSWGIGQMQEWNFAGIPQGTTVATSFVGDEIDRESGIAELKQVLSIVNPCKLYIKTNLKDEKILKDHLDFEVINPYNWG
jgi:hypothetical protein